MGKCRFGASLFFVSGMLFCCVSSVLADDSGLITQQITINVPKAGTLSSLG